MVTTPKSSTRPAISIDGLGKAIGTVATVIGVFVTANTLLNSCSKDRIDRAAAFRTAVKAEEQFWSGLYDRYLAAVATTNEDERRSKLIAVAMLATHDNPEFGEFGAWYESNPAAASATLQLDRMRDVLQAALTDENSSSPAVAQEIQFILDQRNSVRDRVASEGSAQTPPEVTGQAKAATDAKAQAQASVLVPETGTVIPYHGSRILASGPTTGWDVDIFWCAGGDESETFGRALRVGSTLAGAAQSSKPIAEGVTLGRIRLRSLPESQQNKGLFFTSGDAVVADDGAGEKQAAAALGAYVSQQAAVSLRQVRSVGALTNWYLSVFVCPSPAEGSEVPGDIAVTNAS